MKSIKLAEDVKIYIYHICGTPFRFEIFETEDTFSVWLARDEWAYKMSMFSIPKTQNGRVETLESVLEMSAANLVNQRYLTDFYELAGEADMLYDDETTDEIQYILETLESELWG